MTPSEIRINQFRKNGMKIGENCFIFSDNVESNEPYLVTIGDNVIIAADVRFITHDSSVQLYNNDASDTFGKISIGNNCFIGAGSVILPGVSISNNAVIGAGSVVTKSFNEQGVIIGGNPAKRISNIRDLKEKYKGYALNTEGMTFEEKKEYVLANEMYFKKV